jgi:hypothetical protein
VRTLLRGALLEPGEGHAELLFGEEATADASLDSDNRARVASVPQQSDCLKCAGRRRKGQSVLREGVDEGSVQVEEHDGPHDLTVEPRACGMVRAAYRFASPAVRP